MSGQRTNEWKVGAFVVSGVAALVATLFWLGANRFDSEVVERVTYLDESVQGLEVGAPVKIRGVTIGKVSDILLAPDRKLIEVHAEIRVHALRRINAIGFDQKVQSDIQDAPPEMRVTVGSQGITGIKFLEVDYFPADTPVLKLSFDPPENYMPSAPSTMKGLEDAIRRIGEDLPGIVKNLGSLVETLDRKIGEVDMKRLSSSASALTETLTAAIDGTAKEGLGPEIVGLVQDTRVTLAHVDEALMKLTGDGGWADRGLISVEGVAAEIQTTVQHIDQLLADSEVPKTTASIRNAADSAARLAEGARPVGDEAVAALVDLRRAIRSIERLASLLERDPGVLLRGRAFPSDR